MKKWIEIPGNSSLTDAIRMLNDNMRNMTVQTDDLGNAAVTMEKLAGSAVDSSKISDAAIETYHVTDAAIDTPKIASAAIGDAQIDHATANRIVVSSADINDANIYNLSVGTVDASQIQVTGLNASYITCGTLDASAVDIQGTDGKLTLSDNILTVKDANNNPRVLLGKVDALNYGVEIRATDGETVLFNGTGITVDGIPGSTITYEHLKEDLKNSMEFVAGGKAIYYQPDKPPGDAYSDGDLWFDTDDTYKAYKYSGSEWVAMPEDSAAFNVVYMTSALINAGIVTADKIQAGTISADYISGGDLILGGAVHDGTYSGRVVLEREDGTIYGTHDRNGIIFYAPDGATPVATFEDTGIKLGNSTIVQFSLNVDSTNKRSGIGIFAA